jgi:hypothetical protein
MGCCAHGLAAHTGDVGHHGVERVGAHLGHEGHGFAVVVGGEGLEVPTAQGGAKWHASTVRAVIRSRTTPDNAERLPKPRAS